MVLRTPVVEYGRTVVKPRTHSHRPQPCTHDSSATTRAARRHSRWLLAPAGAASACELPCPMRDSSSLMQLAGSCSVQTRVRLQPSTADSAAQAHAPAQDCLPGRDQPGSSKDEILDEVTIHGQDLALAALPAPITPHRTNDGVQCSDCARQCLLQLCHAQ